MLKKKGFLFFYYKKKKIEQNKLKIIMIKKIGSEKVQ